MDESAAAKAAALSDAQDLAEILLVAEAKLGELLGANEPNFRQGKFGKMDGKRPLPPGLDWKASHLAQTIAAHPEVVQQVIAQARQQDLLPTAAAVYREVKRQENAAHLEALRRRPSRAPAGLYDVVVIDPPWPMESSRPTIGGHPMAQGAASLCA